MPHVQPRGRRIAPALALGRTAQTLAAIPCPLKFKLKDILRRCRELRCLLGAITRWVLSESQLSGYDTQCERLSSLVRLAAADVCLVLVRIAFQSQHAHAGDVWVADPVPRCTTFGIDTPFLVEVTRPAAWGKYFDR